MDLKISLKILTKTFVGSKAAELQWFVKTRESARSRLENDFKVP